MTAVAVSDAERAPDRETIVVDCFLGSNWVMTAHGAEIAVLDDFRAVAEGNSAPPGGGVPPAGQNEDPRPGPALRGARVARERQISANAQVAPKFG